MLDGFDYARPTAGAFWSSSDGVMANDLAVLCAKSTTESTMQPVSKKAPQPEPGSLRDTWIQGKVGQVVPATFRQNSGANAAHSGIAPGLSHRQNCTSQYQALILAQDSQAGAASAFLQSIPSPARF